MRRYLLALGGLVVLTATASAGPSIETVELLVGQQISLPIDPSGGIALSNDRVARVIDTDRKALSLVGQSIGQAVITVNTDGGRRTLLVTVAGLADTSRPPVTVANEPVPTATTPARASLSSVGLQVTARVDKPRATPHDTLTYTVSCRNHGPGAESGIQVAAKLPELVELVPTAELGQATWAADTRELQWTLHSLDVGAETSFSFRARLAGANPGDTVAAATMVRSAAMERPRLGEAATTEVVPTPLMAAVAMPDVVLAQMDQVAPLIDVQTAAGQRLIRRLEALGVIDGYPDGSFRPSGEVTRAEATKMVVTVNHLQGLRDRTSLIVALSRPADLTVTIADASGQKLRQLATDWALPAGQHSVIWDGRDDRGKPVAMGTYRYLAVARDKHGLEQSLDGAINVVAIQPMPVGLRSAFRDVPEEAWFHPYVATAERRGIVRGYPGGMFRPNDPITRVENTVLVVRAAGLTDEAEARTNTALGYTDAASIPRWAVGYVAVATDGGVSAEEPLLIGFQANTFLPHQSLTRAEAASVLERLLDRDGNNSVPASGAVAAGHRMLIAGEPVRADRDGRFRLEVTLSDDPDLVRVGAAGSQVTERPGG